MDSILANSTLDQLLLIKEQIDAYITLRIRKLESKDHPEDSSIIPSECTITITDINRSFNYDLLFQIVETFGPIRSIEGTRKYHEDEKSIAIDSCKVIFKNERDADALLLFAQNRTCFRATKVIS